MWDDLLSFMIETLAGVFAIGLLLLGTIGTTAVMILLGYWLIRLAWALILGE